MRRLTLISLLVALAAPAGARATPGQPVFFEAPRDLLDAGARPRALGEMDSLGVRAVRIVLYWHDVAPQPDSPAAPRIDERNPASYDWSKYDPAIAAAQARGWRILLTISGPVPRWATARHRDNVTRPDPREFGQFAQAVGQHYGSAVKLFAIWNEPNHPQFLGPQFSGRRPTSPRIYRALYQAGYAGLRAAPAAAGATILIGETAPRGTGHDVAPLTFLRGALCLDSHYRRAPSCSGLSADGWAHHAYTTLAGPFFRPSEPNDVTIAVLGRLARALDRAGSAGALSPHLPIWLTEFGIQSFPDPFNGVPLAQQPEYAAIAEHLATNNPRVVSFSQYLLRDDPARPGNIFQRHSGFTTGLELASGRHKPSFDGWRLPLAVSRHGSRALLWGIVRPAGGSTTVEVQVAHARTRRWRRLLTAGTDANGVWRARARSKRGLVWRAVWAAPGGTTYSGPPIRAYDGRGRAQ